MPQSALEGKLPLLVQKASELAKAVEEVRLRKEGREEGGKGGRNHGRGAERCHDLAPHLQRDTQRLLQSLQLASSLLLPLDRSFPPFLLPFSLFTPHTRPLLACMQVNAYKLDDRRLCGMLLLSPECYATNHKTDLKDGSFTV